MQNRIDQLVSGMGPAKPHPQTIQSASDAAAVASNQLGKLTKQVEESIARHPVVSLSIGLAIGATLGWLLKRK
jgi:hypothetical protein